MMARQDALRRPQERIAAARLWLLSGLLLVALAGCQGDDCVNCVELPAPVVPTGVHSISGDDVVIVQWYDISYPPYDGDYNDNVVSYIIYSRYYAPGDENDPSREFYRIGEVAWDENFDPVTGLHWFEDLEAVNGEQYEYAVAAKNAAGQESALSYELVTDAPLPMGLNPVELFAVNGDNSHLAGFDFSALDHGRVDPTTPGTTADIQIEFDGGIPYVVTTRPSVHIQDFGVFTDGSGDLIFEGVSWAPADGYSNTGVLELVRGHIYVLEIVDYDGPQVEVYYAKFGVVQIGAQSVQIIWAYQTIQGLPELSVPQDPSPGQDDHPDGPLVYEF